MAKTFLTALQVALLPSDPSAGKRGQVYYNTTTNKFRGYTTLWQDLGSGSGGGSGSSGPIFLDYTGQGINNNSYFVVGSKNNSPVQPLLGDFWIVTDDADEIPYFIATQTTAPDPTQYEFWADPSDFGGDLIYTASAAPNPDYVGQLWIKPDDSVAGEITAAGVAPNPNDYLLWADYTDTQNLAQYGQIYNTASDFPSASSSPGLIAVEQQYGRAYYSDGTNWLGLSALSDSNNLLNISNTLYNYAQYLETQGLNTQSLYWMDSGLGF